MADWTVEVADKIDEWVNKTRRFSVLPVEKAARWIVFGVLALGLGLTALVLIIIGIFRGITNIPWIDEHQWAVYGVIGVILLLAGSWCWSKRSAPTSDQLPR